MMSQAETGSSFGINVAGRAALLALILGVSADLLFVRYGLTGIGFLAWMVLFIGATLILTPGLVQNARSISGWALLALAATLLLFVRSTPVLLPMMLLVLFSCGVNWLLQQREKKLAGVGVLDYPWAALQLPVLYLRSLWMTAGQVDPTVLPRRSVRGVIKGIILALPLVLVFAMLFASADARFSEYMSSMSRVFSFSAVQHLVVMGVFSVLIFGLLSLVLQKPSPRRAGVPEQLSLGLEETLVIMGALAVLFLAFVALQLGYLFGGREVIAQTSGLTLAEYARRGFFEMLVVTAFSLLLLLGMTGMRCDMRVFRPLAGLLVLLVLVIMASALQRLLLYVEEFGLTMDRLLALGVMLWLAGCLAGFVLTVLRGRPRGFASGAATCAIVLLLLAGAVNPAALVARTNLSLALSLPERPLDVGYLLDLGGDAVPLILGAYDGLSESVQCRLAYSLTTRWGPSSPAARREADWRSRNWSRTKAQQAVGERYEEFRSIIQARIDAGLTNVSTLDPESGRPIRLC